jgi:uncharacterized protein YndB with AHSA1/START domain
MNEESAAHETIVLKRTYNASPTRVFAAFEDIEARTIWGAPNDGMSIVFERTDFRVGGVDSSRSGEKNNPQILVEVRYLDIVRNKRIVYSETIERAGKRLSASLVTVDIVGKGSSTDLTVTIQLASFDGADMAGGNKVGYAATLENLAHYLNPVVTLAGA